MLNGDLNCNKRADDFFQFGKWFSQNLVTKNVLILFTIVFTFVSFVLWVHLITYGTHLVCIIVIEHPAVNNCLVSFLEILQPIGRKNN